MPGKMWAVTTILFFHDLFTVIWIGGMVALGLGLVPALRRSVGPGPQTQRIVSVFQNSFRWVAYVCIIGLMATGVLLSRRNPAFEGFFSWADTYGVLLSLKHVLVLIMVLGVIARTTFLAHKTPEGAAAPMHPEGGPTRPQAGPMRPQAGQVRPGGRARLSMLLLFANIGLGVVVLFLSAATTMLTSR